MEVEPKNNATTKRGIKRVSAFLVWVFMSVTPAIVISNIYFDLSTWLRRRAPTTDAFHAALWVGDMMDIIILAGYALCFLVASIFVLASQFDRKHRILLIVLLPVLQWLVFIIAGVVFFTTALRLDY